MEAVKTLPSEPGETPAEALATTLERVCKDKSLQAFLLLDASRAPETRFILEALSSEALCLFDGNAFEDLAEVAPWLVPLNFDGGDDVFDWFMEEAFGRDQGLFLLSSLPARRLKTSLKRGLKVQDETGRDLFFKYYRPSVFNLYLPAFTSEQVDYILRGIDQVWAEDPEDAETLRRYAYRENELRRVDLRLAVDELAEG